MLTPSNSIKSLQQIRQELPASCEVLAVSKLQSVEKIKFLFLQGQRLFAENYVQEGLKKQSELKDLDIEWHFIGRLQKNKAKQVVGAFAYIHSVDSLELAQALNQVAEKKNLVQKILIQINLAEEKTKGGISRQQLAEFLAQTAKLKNIKIVGLMTMPPLFEDPNLARPFFKELKRLLCEQQINYSELKKLSMGTSADYLIAAKEGATLVRLGTILFGERIK